MNEFRPILGFPEYLINNRGELLSLTSGLPKPRKSSYTSYGYKYVCLKNPDGQYRGFMVHRLVLETFVGPCPEGMQTRHLNGIRDDNRVENLVWGTALENSQDRARHGTNIGTPGKPGESHPNAKLNTDQVLEIIGSNESPSLLAKKFGVVLGTVEAVKYRRSWLHIPRPPK